MADSKATKRQKKKRGKQKKRVLTNGRAQGEVFQGQAGDL